MAKVCGTILMDYTVVTHGGTQTHDYKAGEGFSLPAVIVDSLPDGVYELDKVAPVKEKKASGSKRSASKSTTKRKAAKSASAKKGTKKKSSKSK